MQEQETDVEDFKKLDFLARQLELFTNKKYTMQDFCFAVNLFPRTRYEHLRQFLTLPSDRKVKSVVSGAKKEQVMQEVFAKVTEQQKQCLLIVDEVKIRPTVAFSGGVLSGFAENLPTEKASSMLGIMARCLHGGPSVMVSIVPVHKLSGEYQFSVVIEAASLIEKCGGNVVGSITDNHKVNQRFNSSFQRTESWRAVHPLDAKRKWFLLFDPVHLFKCLRNNWYTEKTRQISFDNQHVGHFADVYNLYVTEKESVLKTTNLTSSSVSPSRLQLQNVQHVVPVFNEKVVAALRIQGKVETAATVEVISNWWKTMNVASKGEHIVFNDPHRAAQIPSSTSLKQYAQLFGRLNSGHGASRQQCLTHDTKKALVQTMEGLSELCDQLFGVGFEYVLLREVQSDRLEGN